MLWTDPEERLENTKTEKRTTGIRLNPVRTLIASLLLLLIAAPAHAGNGDVTKARLGNPKLGTGVSVTIDTRWISGDGYRPLRVSAVQMPSSVDRQFTVQITPDAPYRFPERTITQTFDLPAGKKEINGFMYLPENLGVGQYAMKVWLGRNYRGRKNLTSMTQAGNQISDLGPRVMVIDTDAPTFKQLGPFSARAYSNKSADVTNPAGLITALPQMQQSAIAGWSSGKEWFNVVDEIPTCTVISHKDIPPDWIGLSSADIIFISYDDLVAVQSTPDLARPLMEWASNGGNLFITDCGTSFDRREEISKILGIPYASEKPSADDWEAPQRAIYGEYVDSLDPSIDQYGNRRGNTPRPPKTRAPKSAPIIFRDYQLGSVTLFFEADPFEKGNQRYWHWVLNSLGTDRWTWAERNGLSSFKENPGFWQFLVPGVGLAPVKTFAVLLTLFVVTIGPVSFALLKRWKRPNWLMFTVPIAALLVTLGLVMFALLTDGLYVRGRSRTVTHINQRIQRESTWSRQAYYAGLPSSDGLRFPNDCAVYPIDFFPQGDHLNDRTIELGSEQHLRRGFLGARETSQFLVQRCQPTELKLDVLGVDGSQLQFQNKLGGEIAELFIRDDSGNIYLASSIANETTTYADATEFREVSKRLVDIRASAMMRSPRNMDPNSVRMRGGMFGRYYGWNNTYRADNDPLNCGAERALGEFQSNAPNQYLAIMKEPVDIPAGLQNVRWDQTTHIIVGEW